MKLMNWIFPIPRIIFRLSLHPFIFQDPKKIKSFISWKVLIIIGYRRTEILHHTLILPPVNIQFIVKGSNGDGIWNDKGKSIRIIISPPWWRTTIAYIGYFFLFAGIVFGIDRVQRKRIVNRERNAAAINEANLRAQIAETENERKTQELEEARQLQLSMLPKYCRNLPNLDIAVYMKTATEVGGDYYDFNVAMDGTLTVVMGDATGHGMRAGTMVTSAKSLFNSYAANPDILFTFQEMTRCIKQMQFQSLAMSMTMLKIQNNKLLMSSAGMPPVYLFRNKHRIIRRTFNGRYAIGNDG